MSGCSPSPPSLPISSPATPNRCSWRWCWECSCSPIGSSGWWWRRSGSVSRPPATWGSWWCSPCWSWRCKPTAGASSSASPSAPSRWYSLSGWSRSACSPICSTSITSPGMRLPSSTFRWPGAVPWTARWTGGWAVSSSAVAKLTSPSWWSSAGAWMPICSARSAGPRRPWCSSAAPYRWWRGSTPCRATCSASTRPCWPSYWWPIAGRPFVQQCSASAAW